MLRYIFSLQFFFNKFGNLLGLIFKFFYNIWQRILFFLIWLSNYDENYTNWKAARQIKKYYKYQAILKKKRESKQKWLLRQQSLKLWINMQFITFNYWKDLVIFFIESYYIVLRNFLFSTYFYILYKLFNIFWWFKNLIICSFLFNIYILGLQFAKKCLFESKWICIKLYMKRILYWKHIKICLKIIWFDLLVNLKLIGLVISIFFINFWKLLKLIDKQYYLYIVLLCIVIGYFI